MEVIPVSAFTDNYIWLIIDKKAGAAICVDPGEAQPVLAFLEKQKLALEAILLTHHHYDHIGGVTALVANNPEIKVYGPSDSRIPQVNNKLQAEERLSLFSCQFHILSTPGHTATHISIHEPNYGWLFCGDTLFSAGCGRVFDGTIDDLHQSLQKLKALPDKTQVYCAHEYTQKNLRFAAIVEPDNLAIRHHAAILQKNNACSLPSTIGLEKQINPFLRTEEKNVQIYTSRKGTKAQDSLSVFKQLRADKDIFN